MQTVINFSVFSSYLCLHRNRGLTYPIYIKLIFLAALLFHENDSLMPGKKNSSNVNKQEKKTVKVTPLQEKLLKSVNTKELNWSEIMKLIDDLKPK